MRIGTVRRVRIVEEFWHVTVGDWKSDLQAGQLIEQVRGEESMLVWEVLAENEDSLVLSPTTMNAPNGFPVPTQNKPDLKPGDHFDACVGGRLSHLGLGDLIAKATKAVGFEPCEGCEERRKKLNRLFPKIVRR